LLYNKACAAMDKAVIVEKYSAFLKSFSLQGACQFTGCKDTKYVETTSQRRILACTTASGS